MSQNSIEINGKIIPLPEGSVLAINYRANDIRNPSSRDGAYAETLTLPETHLVRRALENSQLLTSGTNVPYQLLPAVIRHKGNIVLTGHAGHTEVNEGYALDVDGENADLFEMVKGKNLRDIDLSDLDHAYTNANVFAGNSDDPARGYLYPLINTGAWNNRFYDASNQHYTEVFPAVYASTLLERIAAPYTLTGSLLTDARFEKLVVPFVNGEFMYREAYREQYAITGKVETEYVYDLSDLTPPGTTPVLMFPAVTGNPAYFDGQTFFAPVKGRYKVKSTVKLNAFLDPDYTNFLQFLVVTAAGGLIHLIEQGYTAGEDQAISFEYTTPTLLPGDKIYIALFPGTTVVQNDNYFLPGSSFEVELMNQVAEGGPVHLEANLPDMDQEDFLHTIFNLFNVLIQTDPIRGIIRLDLLEGLRTSAAVDWSKKIDWSKSPRFTFDFSNYGQANIFGYDPLEYQDSFGVEAQDITTIPVINERLEAAKEFFISPFTSTEMRPAFNGYEVLPYVPSRRVKVNSLGLWRLGIEYSDQDYVYYQGNYWHANITHTSVEPTFANTTQWEVVPLEDVYELNEATPRLLLVEDREGAAIPVGDNGPSGTFNGFTVHGVFFKEDGTGINAEAMRLNYHSITEIMLTQTRILTLNIRLKLPDISALDFLRPVALNVPGRNLQGLFYLNAVNQWNPEAVSTEVELVRMFGLQIPVSGTPARRVHKAFSYAFSDSWA